MAVKRIWMSGIRMLNTPIDHDSERSSALEYIEFLKKSSPLEMGQVNIFIGENGAGKSTVIDTVRALGDLHVLASLPRENPPKQGFPAFSVEFASGLCTSYLFSPHPMDKTLNGIDYVSCCQFIERPSSLQIRQSDLFRKAPYSPLSILPVEGIHYRSGTQPTDEFDETFIATINGLRHHFTGLAGRPSERFHSPVLEHSSMHLSDDGMLGVYLMDDLRMGNQLRGEWLPSGWKAFAWTVSWLRNCPDNTICLIEEPESHLHPTLMRALLETLTDIAHEKKLQLFISTHSASLINSAAVRRKSPSAATSGGVPSGVKIFQSHTTHIECKPNLGALLDRMGYLASDMLLANCVIWVEGPSDRLYLNHWIAQAAPDLEESTHYTIMFYGGRLLSHLEAEDSQSGKDFIKLATLNRHCAILLDSDRSSPTKRLNDTKRRILKAFSGTPERLAWVTKGREIENYLDPEQLESAIKAVHKHAGRMANQGQWANLMQYKKPRGRKPFPANKVKVAEQYVQHDTSGYASLDLSQRVHELCQFIRRWN